MIVVNGVENHSTEPADFELASRSTKQIRLPYVGRIWGDMLYEIMQLAYLQDPLCQNEPNLLYEDVVKEASMEMRFNIQKERIYVTALVTATSAYDVPLSGFVLVNAEDNEVSAILDSFFSAGAPGVALQFAKYFWSIYKHWKEHKK